MKKIFLACAVALGISVAASAENYMQVYAGYAGTSPTNHFGYKYGDVFKEVKTLNGFEVGYTYGLGLGEESPMAVEFGLNLGYQTWSEDIYDLKVSVNQFNIKVPVNFTYKFNISESFAIAPYAGINFRFNPLFECEQKGDGGTYKDKEGFKKFQMGWQVGAKVYYKKFFLYGQYGTDFLNAVKVGDIKVKDSTFAVGVGYQF